MPVARSVCEFGRASAGAWRWSVLLWAEPLGWRSGLQLGTRLEWRSGLSAQMSVLPMASRWVRRLGEQKAVQWVPWWAPLSAGLARTSGLQWAPWSVSQMGVQSALYWVLRWGPMSARLERRSGLLSVPQSGRSGPRWARG